MKISAFTYGHNLIQGGYPFIQVMDAVRPFVDEVVVVDAASDDGTVGLLLNYSAKHDKVLVVDGRWGNKAGETLARLHAMHAEHCTGDVVLHMEADEVWDPKLASWVCHYVRKGTIGPDVRVWRLQISQNFQKCRWYPEPVHRVFPRGTVRKVGHTTDKDHPAMDTVGPEWGFLWDCTNCFRDNWVGRLEQQAALRSEPLNMLAVPRHVNEPKQVSDVSSFLAQEFWTWNVTPFNVPDALRPLVGQVRYEPEV